MIKNYGKSNIIKEILKSTAKILSAGYLSTNIVGCSNPPDHLLFDGKIDGQQIVYYHGDWNSPDRMEIYPDSTSSLIFIIEDYDESGVIGDNHNDRFIVVNGDNNQKIYKIGLVTSTNGITYYGQDNIINKEALKISKKKMEEADLLYQKNIDNIIKKLDGIL